MIPLRDSVRSRRFPIMTALIILVNIIVFGFEWRMSDAELALFFARYALFPNEIVSALALGGYGFDSLARLQPLATAIFLHGGWVHLLSNMLFLWVFGDNIEDRMGSVRFLVFFLLAGIVGNLAHSIANPTLDLPTVGASGSVAGVLGAYMICFPRARVFTLLILGFFVMFVDIPAVFFLLYWFFLQLASGVASVHATLSGGGVAWWAHVGGFIGGILATPFMPRRRKSW